MTHVMNISASSPLSARNTLKVYDVEIVDFYGEHFQESIEAFSEESAMLEAASLYSEVDYVMVNGSRTA